MARRNAPFILLGIADSVAALFLEKPPKAKGRAAREAPEGDETGLSRQTGLHPKADWCKVVPSLRGFQVVSWSLVCYIEP